ncbi:MAG: hypothetical protein ACKPJF_21860, partial [Dolichospermum sp.]
MYDYLTKATKHIQIEPSNAVLWNFNTTKQKLTELLGDAKVKDLLNEQTVVSPVSHLTSGDWLKNSKIVGVNPRA